MKSLLRSMVLALMVSIFTLSTPLFVAAQPTLSVLVNGNPVNSDVQPVISNDRVLVPIRAVSESLGATVNWYNETKTVVVTKGSTVIQLTVDSKEIVGTFGRKEIDVPAQLMNDRVFLPVRAVAELFGCTVNFDDATRQVQISMPDNPGPTAPSPVTPPDSPSRGSTSSPVVTTPQLTRVYKSGAGIFSLNITGAANITYKAFELSNPHRLVVDLSNVTTDIPKGSLPVSGGPVNGVRLGIRDDGGIRIVYDLAEPDTGTRIKYTISQTPTGITVDFNRKAIRIVIDPGHGGKDTGAIGNAGVQEKDVVLSVSLKLASALKAMGIETILTRSDDTFVELEDRAELSHDKAPDLFLSIHVNSADSPEAHGTETWYRYEEYANLASVFEKDLAAGLGRTDRGVKDGNLWVLKPEEVPSILVELAFISNSEEEALLKSQDFQNKAVSGLVKGVRDYFKLR
ncbi:N-acetylmuramoyl-L-alanine amidase [Heliobacterium chlorum]|uniref:N-acetylmuramoyl-L-alanine amidase n=1 Tax=Heliobacterium chlorum TaxID=2698 RepID=A0ABR7T2K9_HELCL|nr:N-acetylmuramoyl-L-alanine amidase family protein [Heliobacterium chlorum]MBC9784104.1 N-acetylmuramoyl-L-alanine amidase [Heliobacterium chlorum]